VVVKHLVVLGFSYWHRSLIYFGWDIQLTIDLIGDGTAVQLIAGIIGTIDHAITT